MDKYIESEIQLLSVLMHDNKYMLTCLDELKVDDFYSTNHQLIYKTMVNLYKNDVRFDSIVIIRSLEKEIKLNVISITEISNIETSFTTSQTFNSHLKIIQEASKNRKIAEMCKKLINNNDSIDKKIELINNTVLKINSKNENDKIITMPEAVESTISRIDKAIKSKDGITGIPTGIKSLDDCINGLERGSMIIFGARPSMGKTAFSINMIKDIKAKVLFVQLDMTIEGMIQRMLATRTRYSNKDISRGKLTDNQLCNVIKESGSLSMKENIFLYSPARATVTNILLKAKEVQAKYGLDVIIIDHIGKIASETRGSKYEQMTEISNRLKAMFRELKVAGVVLCQLSRGCEARADKRPMLSDLRDTGAIEEDADVIGFLYRDGYYNDKECKVDELEVSIQKNRNGECGTIGFEYRLNTQELIPII